MSKTALVVDDSPTMRQMVAFTLTNAGFKVVEAEDGKDAVNKVAAGPKMDIVVTDLNMPEIDGPALYKQVLTRWPVAAPRALFVSGDADLGPYHDDPMLRDMPVLFKPFTLSDLFSALHRALARSSHVGL